MDRRTFTVPNISCGHCTHTIKMELSELPGVKSVDADIASRQVTVEWDAPANWDKDAAKLLAQRLYRFERSLQMQASTGLYDEL